jgi:hypothetical protein
MTPEADMEIPEHLRDLVDRLGQALVQALVTDEQCRDLARQIQEGGFEVGLMIEATLALHKREDDASSPEEDAEPRIIRLQGPESSLYPDQTEREGPQWSEEDRAFLQKFKIALD